MTKFPIVHREELIPQGDLPEDFDKLAQIHQELRVMAKELDITIITAQQPRPARFYSVADHSEAMKGIIFVDPIGLLHR